jgi:hypothetical protein
VQRKGMNELGIIHSRTDASTRGYALVEVSYRHLPPRPFHD